MFGVYAHMRAHAHTHAHARNSGMRSSDVTVRSRAAYMFFRLCRAQKNLLLPYLPQILAASQVPSTQLTNSCIKGNHNTY
jgi:hypothetical protein